MVLGKMQLTFQLLKTPMPTKQRLTTVCQNTGWRTSVELISAFVGVRLSGLPCAPAVVGVFHQQRLEKISPALWTGLLAFWPHRAFFFGSAFFCAELFFLVGLFFLGSAVFFGIQLNLILVNYLLMAAAHFFPFFHVVLSEAATVQPEYKWTKICYKVKYDSWSRSAARAYGKSFRAVGGVLNKK